MVFQGRTPSTTVPAGDSKMFNTDPASSGADKVTFLLASLSKYDLPLPFRESR